MFTTKTNGSAPLSRQVGALGMLFTAVSGMVGSGWLFASLYAAQIAGPAAIISWLIGGFVAMTLAMVYSELGGCSLWLGPWPEFLTSRTARPTALWQDGSAGLHTSRRRRLR